MSYFVFHLVFILPPILLLALVQPSPLAGIGGLRARLALPLIALMALVYTTPWDNYRDLAGCVALWHRSRGRDYWLRTS